VPVGHGEPGADLPLRQVEVQEHRLAVARDQDVRGLDVEVDEAPVVGVLERIGQARPDPADRLHVRRLRQVLPERPAERLLGRQRHRGAVERVEDLRPRAVRDRDRGELDEQPRERRAAEVGHAHHPEVAVGEDLLEIERDDVHVLQPCERQVLVVVSDRHDLQDHEAVGERVLAGEVGPPDRAPADLGEESEVAEVVAGRGEIGGGGGPEEPVAVQQERELGAPAGEAAEDLRLGRGRVFPVFQAEAGFLIDDPDRVHVAEPGIALEDFLGPGPLAAFPGRGHLLGQPRDLLARSFRLRRRRGGGHHGGRLLHCTDAGRMDEGRLSILVGGSESSVA
jgi:hypothetical protein